MGRTVIHSIIVAVTSSCKTANVKVCDHTETYIVLYLHLFGSMT